MTPEQHDSKTEEARHRCSPDWMNTLVMLVFYTDQPKHLRSSDYDQRLAKCWDDARRLYNSKPGELASPSHLPAREAIERAADALQESRRHVVENLTRMYGHAEFGEIRRIDAAIAALQPLSQGDGDAVAWQLAPKEPTEAMIHAAFDEVELRPSSSPQYTNNEARRRIYKAMLAAAPATPPSQPEGVREALQYATHLAESLAAKHYADVPQWRPLPDLIGVLTQIDNMTTGLARTTTPSRGLVEAAECERAGLNRAAEWHEQRRRDTPDVFEGEFHEVCAKHFRTLSAKGGAG